MTSKPEPCVFCGTKLYTVFEKNNPAPAKDHGVCCSHCNDNIVIPTRLADLIKRERAAEEVS